MAPIAEKVGKGASTTSEKTPADLRRKLAKVQVQRQKKHQLI